MKFEIRPGSATIKFLEPITNANIKIVAKIVELYPSYLVKIYEPESDEKAIKPTEAAINIQQAKAQEAYWKKYWDDKMKKQREDEIARKKSEEWIKKLIEKNRNDGFYWGDQNKQSNVHYV